MKSGPYEISRGAAITAALLMLTGVAPLTGQTDRNDDISIYAAVAKIVISEARDSLIVVSHATNPSLGRIPRLINNTPHTPGAVDHPMALDFQDANAVARPVPPFALKGVVIRAVPDSIVELLGRIIRLSGRRQGNPEGYWAEFNRRFPGATGLLSVSGIGYSRDGREAVVVADFSCGVLCGRGKVALLQKQGGVWMVEKLLSAWRY